MTYAKKGDDVPVDISRTDLPQANDVLNDIFLQFIK